MRHTCNNTVAVMHMCLDSRKGKLNTRHLRKIPTSHVSTKKLIYLNFKQLNSVHSLLQTKQGTLHILFESLVNDTFKVITCLFVCPFAKVFPVRECMSNSILNSYTISTQLISFDIDVPTVPKDSTYLFLWIFFQHYSLSK